MQIPINHTSLGPGVLTDERAESSHGQPVFVADSDGQAYGPGDAPGFLLRAGDYSPDQERWFDWVRSAPESPAKWRLKAGRPAGSVVKDDAERTKARSVWLTDAEYARLLAVNASPSEAVRKLLAK